MHSTPPDIIDAAVQQCSLRIQNQRLSGLRQSYGNVDVTRSVAYRNSHRTLGERCGLRKLSLVAVGSAHFWWSQSLLCLFAFSAHERSQSPPAKRENKCTATNRPQECLGKRMDFNRRNSIFLASAIAVAKTNFLGDRFFSWKLFGKSESLFFFILQPKLIYRKKKCPACSVPLNTLEGTKQNKKSKVSLFQNPLAANSCYVTGWPPLSVNGFATQFINRCVLAESALAISIIWISNASEKMWVILLEFYDTRIKSIEI